MKNKEWTIEELTELWEGRGYGKRKARKLAEEDHKEMHREITHEDIQDIWYN